MSAAFEAFELRRLQGASNDAPPGLLQAPHFEDQLFDARTMRIMSTNRRATPEEPATDDPSPWRLDFVLIAIIVLTVALVVWLTFEAWAPHG